jgi:hypothetical protein
MRSAMLVALAGLGTLAGADDASVCSPPGRLAADRLRLDVEARVECALRRDPASGLLRREERIEVTARSPEALLQRFLKPEDVRGGPPQSPAPGQPGYGSVNLVPLLQALLGKLSGGGGPFYLYLLTTPRGSTGELREEPIPAGSLVRTGAVYEPMGTYRSAREALAALRQLESRGRPAPEPGVELVGPPAP